VQYDAHEVICPKKSLKIPKGAIPIRSRKPKDRQDNGQKENVKRTDNDIRTTTQKAKDRVTRTPLNTEVN